MVWPVSQVLHFRSWATRNRTISLLHARPAHCCGATLQALSGEHCLVHCSGCHTNWCSKTSCFYSFIYFSLGWLQIHDPTAKAFQVLGLQTCSQKSAFFMFPWRRHCPQLKHTHASAKFNLQSFTLENPPSGSQNKLRLLDLVAGTLSHFAGPRFTIRWDQLALIKMWSL